MTYLLILYSITVFIAYGVVLGVLQESTTHPEEEDFYFNHIVIAMCAGLIGPFTLLLLFITCGFVNIHLDFGDNYV